MRVGVISDIHANLPALEAVLDDMPAVDELICLGDIVGYNPHPGPCVDLVRQECDHVVQGNHDREIRNPAAYGSNPQAEAGLRYAEAELTDQQIEWLSTLPERIVVDEFLTVHSHPERTDIYVFPGDAAELRPYLDEHSGVLLGHTHVQHELASDDGVVVNPGSVGQPRDGTAAKYAVVDTDSPAVDLYATSYSIERAATDIRQSRLPDSAAQRLVPQRERRPSRNPWR